MKPEFKTLALAKIYERQGCFQEALDIYKHLEDPEQGSDITEARKRMETAVEKGGQNLSETDTEKRLEPLLEQWVKLLILKNRLALSEKLKARF